MDEVKAIRTKLGLSQKALADRLGVHQSQVSRWEASGLTRDFRVRLAIAKLLREAGVPPHEADDLALSINGRAA